MRGDFDANRVYAPHRQMSWNRAKDGSILLIAYGLLSDDVVGVQIEIESRNHDVVVGENGFLFETDKHDPDDVNGFHVVYRDGTSATTVCSS
jgi:hypothetical protein